MSLDDSALKNLCLWCEFQSRLLFIISLLLKTFSTALSKEQTIQVHFLVAPSLSLSLQSIKKGYALSLVLKARVFWNLEMAYILAYTDCILNTPLFHLKVKRISFSVLIINVFNPRRQALSLILVSFVPLYMLCDCSFHNKRFDTCLLVRLSSVTRRQRLHG